MNIVAILANGIGTRFGSNVPKQFHKVNGKMIIEYVVESILKSYSVDKIIIATNIEMYGIYISQICNKNDIDMIQGGSTRNRTLKKTIDYIGSKYQCDNLIVCDSVRPLITSAIIDEYFELMKTNDAVVTVQHITDSLGCYDLEKVDRSRYYLMQSPEAFDYKLLSENFDSESSLTEVTQQLPNNSKINLYFGFTNNVKLTYPADLKYLESILIARDNNVSFEKVLESVTRLNKYLSLNYPRETAIWQENLTCDIPKLLKSWQITDYRVIKTSHFGIIFLANSVKYGECVLKIIPPFINRYFQERMCYQRINPLLMCELYDYDDGCNAILLERCYNTAEIVFSDGNEEPYRFFKKEIESSCKSYSNHHFNNYKKILNHKIFETDFEYNNNLIMNYVKKAISVFNKFFDEKDFTLIHGDLHRYNIMKKDSTLVAIDPIGYIAPHIIDVARYIGTEIIDGENAYQVQYDNIINYFSRLFDVDLLKKAVFVDVVFRLHNSVFENDNYDLTDKWLNLLNILYKNKYI